MVKVFFNLFVFSSIIFSIQLNGQDSWQRYNAPDGSFYVKCPGGLLEYKEQETITELGKLKNKAYFLEMSGDHPNFLYMITSVQYPEGTFQKDSILLIQEFLSESGKSLQESTGCKSQYELVNHEDTVPNMVMRLYDEKSQTAIKVRMMIKNDILYTLQAYTNHDNKLNEYLDLFLNSFYLK